MLEISGNSSKDQLRGAIDQRIPFHGRETDGSLHCLKVASLWELFRALLGFQTTRPMTGKLRSLPSCLGWDLGGTVLLETKNRVCGRKEISGWQKRCCGRWGASVQFVRLGWVLGNYHWGAGKGIRRRFWVLRSYFSPVIDIISFFCFIDALFFCKSLQVTLITFKKNLLHILIYIFIYCNTSDFKYSILFVI